MRLELPVSRVHWVQVDRADHWDQPVLMDPPDRADSRDNVVVPDRPDLRDQTVQTDQLAFLVSRDNVVSLDQVAYLVIVVDRVDLDSRVPSDHKEERVRLDVLDYQEAQAQALVLYILFTHYASQTYSLLYPTRSHSYSRCSISYSNYKLNTVYDS